MTESPASTAPASARKLNAELIMDTAIEFIEAEGLSAFSMRALGAKLGVSAMALYGYYPSKEDLFQAIAKYYLTLMDTAPIPGERWDDTIIRCTSSLRRVSLEHPQLYVLRRSLPPNSPIYAEYNRRVITGHLAQGIPQELFAQCWGILDAYMRGFIDMNIRTLLAKSAASTHPDDAWHSIPEGSYSDEAFLHGLKIIIQGICGIAAPDPCEWYTPEQ